MRSIEYRVWDGEGMHTGIDLRSYKEDYDGFYSKGSRELIEDGDHLSAFMQSTGLKDKNGVEIYEGDVLEYGSDGTGLTLDVYLQNVTVAWSDKVFGFNVFPAMSVCWEVIGNIYENPELLGGGDE